MSQEKSIIYHGDCLDAMRGMADNSVDAIVTDPPYGLKFMNKHWDAEAPSVEIWRECLRVLKPGGHLLSFAGTRTQHRMAVNIEDAGFEIRDMIAWVYGSGFPKSLDVSKAIDKEANAVREIIGERPYSSSKMDAGRGVSGLKQVGSFAGEYSGHRINVSITSPATEAAREWEGWGTALKPALEPITVARKPLTGTVAENVLRWGTGGLNVDGCRVGDEPPAPRNALKKIMRGGKFHAAADTETEMSHYNPTQGRWPANLIHDGSDEVTRPLGSAARFFYCAKASKRERDHGLDDRTPETVNDGRQTPIDNPYQRGETARRNTHATVKPVALMRYLCRLVTPPNGTVLDPFMGSGSTGIAALQEGFCFVGVEREEEYVAIAQARIAAALQETP